MAEERVPRAILENLLEMVRSTDELDVLRETAQWTLQQLIEADVARQIGAERHERTQTRTNRRNGSRRRLLKTRLGDLTLRIPKLRSGSYYPEWLLERGNPAEQAVLSVVVEAYVNGVSTRKMDRLVTEMGLEGVDKSTVSRINKGLDRRVADFQSRSLRQVRYPYLWLDATFPKVREDGRVQGTALVVGIGVREDGYREILGLALGAAETEAAWLDFLRGLKARGLSGVQLVISDAHQGLKNAVQAVFTGAAWQRCRVHFTRDLLTHVAKSAHDEVPDQLHTIFEQPCYDTAKAQLLSVAENLQQRFPKAAALLEDAVEDLLAHMSFPRIHWRHIRSTNPLERLNREINRRFKVVGVFPNRAAVTRLGGAVLLEQHETWLAERRFFGEPSMRQVLPQQRPHRPSDAAPLREAG